MISDDDWTTDLPPLRFDLPPWSQVRDAGIMERYRAEKANEVEKEYGQNEEDMMAQPEREEKFQTHNRRIPRFGETEEQANAPKRSQSPLSFLSHFNPIGTAQAQEQDSEGNVVGPLGRLYKNSRETSEQHRMRLEPVAQDIEQLFQKHESRIGKDRAQFTPQQLHQIHNSREMLMILRRVPSATGR